MRAFPACCSLAGLLILFFQGACSNGGSFERAQKAEEAGRYDQAYERYCDTARESPSSGSVADSIERVRPYAVAYWEGRAAKAVEEGRYADGWKMWMRVLDMQPDHRIAAARILELQTRHAVAIRSARADWLSRGFLALAVSDLDRESEIEEPFETVASRTEKKQLSDEQQFAMVSPDQDAIPPMSFAGQKAWAFTPTVASPPHGQREITRTRQQPAPPSTGDSSPASHDVRASSLPGTADLAHTDEASRETSDDVIEAVTDRTLLLPDSGTDQQPTVPATTLARAASSQAPSAAKQPEHVVQSVLRPNVSKPKRAPRETSLAPSDRPKTSQPRRPRLILPIPQRPPLVERPSPSPSRGDSRPLRPTAMTPAESMPKANNKKKAEPEPEGYGEFIVLRTLSRNDHRYPRTSELLDGVNAKLKDTDDDLDADFNLYIRDKRINKIRELSVGRSSMFRGQSGKRYMLTVLSVHHRTRTVRIGIRPA